jgi:7-cyano-7-deazaguanine reductase
MTDNTSGESETRTLRSVQAPEGQQITTFETNELTAICPFDFGGPDYYDLTLRYVADNAIVESKSLKLYLEAFRDEEITAEALCHRIYTDIAECISPDGLYVELEQSRRGGIEETVEEGDYELRR